MGVVIAGSSTDYSPSQLWLVAFPKDYWCSIASKTRIKRVYTKSLVSRKRTGSVRFSLMRIDSTIFAS